MPPIIWSVLLIGSLAAHAVPQDVLYYKFEAGGGRKVINYASESAVAPAEGEILSQSGYAPATLWTGGALGSYALRASTDPTQRIAVETGWDAAMDGSFTFACFVKIRPGRAPDSGTLFLGTGSISLTLECVAGTRTNAGNGLQVRGFNSSDSLTLTKDILTPALTRWVHVALVVDSPGLIAQYFVDGVPELPVSLSRAVSMVRGRFNLSINGRTSTGGTPSFFDMDEFRWSNRVVPAAEIQQWAATDLAGHGPYGAGCHGIHNAGAWLDSTGVGLPTPGNGAYAYQLEGFPNSVFSLGLGSGRSQLGAIPLPFDLGVINPAWSGCLWESSGDLAYLGGNLDVGGRGSIGLPLPNDPNLVGVTLFSQAALIYPPTGMLMLSNGFSSAIGN